MSPLFGFDALAWSALFSGVLLALWWIVVDAKKSGTAKSFLGGHEDEYTTPPGGFYGGFKDALHPVFAALEAYQSGSLNDYISYAIAFTAMVAAAVMLTGRLLI